MLGLKGGVSRSVSEVSSFSVTRAKGHFWFGAFWLLTSQFAS